MLTKDELYMDDYDDWNFAQWCQLIKENNPLPDIKALYEGEVYCAKIVHISPIEFENEATDLLKKIKSFVRVKNSSFETILKLIPRVKSGRSKVLPLSVSLFSVFSTPKILQFTFIFYFSKF